MRDCDVRQVLRARLSRQHSSEPDTLLIDELGLCGTVRVDVAVVNGHLAGYEIKSARDTLRRLPTQVEVYSQVLDFAHLVVAGKHYEDARQILRPWWGLHVAVARGGELSIDTVQEPRYNPEVNRLALAQLLWREEALEELTLRGLDRGVRTKARWHVWCRLADSVPTDELRDIVRRRLKGRLSWRVDQRPARDGVT